jgi:hypothetical protein
MNPLFSFYIVKWEKELKLQEQAQASRLGRRLGSGPGEIEDIREITSVYQERSRASRFNSEKSSCSGALRGMEQICP